MRQPHLLLILLVAAIVAAQDEAAAAQAPLSDERVVLQTSFGDIEIGFFPTVAPKSSAVCSCTGLLVAALLRGFVGAALLGRLRSCAAAVRRPCVAVSAAARAWWRRASHLRYVSHRPPPSSASQHIFKLFSLGGYITNHIFRVDRGFVAQLADVSSGRRQQMSPALSAVARDTVPLEVVPHVKHLPGVLSMARHDDPNSGGSSFSLLLGRAPHLDMQYAIFGCVTSGMKTLRAMEGVETTTSGIFVMPKVRAARGSGASARPPLLAAACSVPVTCGPVITRRRRALRSLRRTFTASHDRSRS